MLTPRPYSPPDAAAEVFVYPDALSAPWLLRPVPAVEIVDCRKREPVEHAMAGWTPASPDRFVVEKGQFSLCDLLLALLPHTGPADLALSTWAASGEDLSRAAAMFAAGGIRSVRLLSDRSFTRRAPALATQIRAAFGAGCIRACPIHAKFALLTGERATVAVRTSMNLDFGDAFENAWISTAPPVTAHLARLVADAFATPTGHRGLAPRPVELRPRTDHTETTTEARRRAAGAAIVARWRPGCELWGLTAGDCSLLDVLRAALAVTGPAEVLVSTWTVSRADVAALHTIQTTGAATTVRLLVDVYTLHREPATRAVIANTLGVDALRFTRNHAKACLLRSPRTTLAILTSANLNYNPRAEDVTLTDAPAVTAYLWDVYASIWDKQHATLSPSIGGTARDFRANH